MPLEDVVCVLVRLKDRSAPSSELKQGIRENLERLKVTEPARQDYRKQPDSSTSLAQETQTQHPASPHPIATHSQTFL